MNERDPEEIVKGLLMRCAFADMQQYGAVMSALAHGLAVGLAMQRDRARMREGMVLLFNAVAHDAALIHEKASGLYAQHQAEVARLDPEFQSMLKGLLDG